MEEPDALGVKSHDDDNNSDSENYNIPVAKKINLYNRKEYIQ